MCVCVCLCVCVRARVRVLASLHQGLALRANLSKGLPRRADLILPRQSPPYQSALPTSQGQRGGPLPAYLPRRACRPL